MTKPALLLLATTVGCAATSLPDHLSITRLSVGFVSDRPEANRLAGHAPSSDLLFFDVEIANPDHVPRAATVVCVRSDHPEQRLKQQVALQPRSAQRHRIMGLWALPVAYQVRCRLEPTHTQPGKWTELVVPANDTTLSSPI
jgi:hypothetical protein